MCWRTIYRKYKKPHISKRNINVCKVVAIGQDNEGNTIIRPKCRSRELIYELNKQYNTHISIEDYTYLAIITKGFHSYAYRLLKYKGAGYCEAIMHCIIPKGTTYYLNESGEYVSESLIPLSIENRQNKDYTHM